MERRRSDRPVGVAIAALLVAGTFAISTTGAAAQDPQPDPEPVELSEVTAPQPLVAEPQAGEEEPIPELAREIDDGDADPTDLRGEEAVEVLEQTELLDDVAVNAGLSEDELVEELVEDPTMFVAATGEVGYVEMFAPHGDDHEHLEHGDDHEHLEHGDDHGGVAGLEVLSGNVFALESNPTAAAVLYLDVTGHTTTSPTWTANTGLAQIESTAFDRDNDPSTFSVAEQQEIREIWERVAEDYAPFDVNVTTRSDLDATVVDQRVVITPSNFLAPLVPNASQILGVAILSSFRNGPETPAFAFTGQPFSRADIVAETVAHEAGHTFGLRHDGQRVGAGVDEYYFGHAGWAPIMGNPVGSDVSQWSRGEYRCANRTEDDLSTIAERVAGPNTGYRGDDWPATAGGPAFAGPGSVTGTIGAGGDVDAIRVDTGGGPITVTVRPTSPSPNLHPSLVVSGPSGSVLGAHVPREPAGSATVSLPSVSGSFIVVEIAAAAWYGPIAGFGTYGSMGGYEISVTPGFTPPDLRLSSPADSVAAAVGLDRQPVC